MSLLQRADVVRPVARHERRIPQCFKGREDEFFLRGRDARVDPCVLHEDVPCLRARFELLECGAGDADVVGGEEGGVERFGRVDGDDLGFVDGTPGEVRGRRGVLADVEDEGFAVYDFDVFGDVDGCEGVVARDHDALDGWAEDGG